MKQGEQERILDGFVQALKGAAGENLLSVLVYGSAASQEFSEKYSDLNLLAVFRHLTPEDLASIAPVLRWWSERDEPSALVFTTEELERAADVFAIELLDIKNHHRIFFGADPISNLEVPLKYHRLEVERELRTAIIRLRQRYPSVARNKKQLLEVMIESSSAFHTLFRHALIALGEPAPVDRSTTLDRLESVLNLDLSPLRTLISIREGKLSSRDVNITETFSGYLRALCAAADQVDKQLPR